MADLTEFEDELLDIAHWQKKTPARDGSSKGGGRARRQVATVSSDEEDDRDAEDREDGEEGRRGGGRRDQHDDEDEEEYGAESDDEPAGKERKGKSSQKVPVKKRSGGRAQDSEEDDDSDEDDDDDDDKREYDSDLSFGSDLYKSREDKKALMAMTELEREMILAERAEKREQVLSFKKRQREKREAQAEADAQGQERADERRPKAAPPARGNRTSHSNALEELRRKRERRDAVTASERRHLSPPKRRRRSPSVSPSDRDEESDDNESRSGRSRSRSPSRSPTRSRSGSASRSPYSASEHRSDAGESEDDDDRRKPEPEAEIGDIQKIVIRRGKLAKWFMEPFFEKTVEGCLVRLGIGTDANNNPQYRLVEVQGVDARDVSKTYKFEGRTTYKWLDVKFGDMRARWQMTRVSDKPPTERDVREWFRELDRVGISRPTLADIDEKCEQLNKVATFKYTPEMVKQMVMEKRQAGERPRNLAMERERLRKEIDVLRSVNETEEIERIQQQLTELENFMQTQKHANDTRAARLANMNKKNREQNFKNAAESQNFDGKDGVQDTLDPFSRRWTRSQNYYKKPDAKEGDAVVPDVKPMESVKPVVAGGEVVVGSLVDSRVQQEETPRVVAVHNFELPIRLDALERFGYGKGTANGFMARKMRLETTCGVQIEPLDPRRKRVKLTIDDYQRRQQLK